MRIKSRAEALCEGAPIDIGASGGVSKTVLGFGRLGGASAKFNYYTLMAKNAGYSTLITGLRVRAGIFVQLNHNLGRALGGNFAWKTLYSNSAATVMGRQWQNEAIRDGFIGVGVGTGSLFYNMNK